MNNNILLKLGITDEFTRNAIMDEIDHLRGLENDILDWFDFNAVAEVISPVANRFGFPKDRLEIIPAMRVKVRQPMAEAAMTPGVSYRSQGFKVVYNLVQGFEVDFILESWDNRA